jgi:hypothetical protein
MTDLDGDDSYDDLEESVYDINDNDEMNPDGEVDGYDDLEESVYDVNDDDKMNPDGRGRL